MGGWLAAGGNDVGGVMMYRSTQPGTLVVVSLLVAVIGAIAFGFSTGLHRISLSFAGVVLVFLILFRSLTIEIDSRQFRCFFADGIIRRRFPLSEIIDVIPVRNKWYYGWGIRLTPFGWMFNIAGLDAVELCFASGKCFRIGTDKPLEVIEAFKQFKALAG